MDMADGTTVPDECVRALDGLAETWPGSTFPAARAAVVRAVLDAHAATRRDAVAESQDLIRSLIPQRHRPGDGVEVVDVHGCTWTEDAFGTWTSPMCEESPLATRTDIEIAAGPLVEVERA